MTYSVKVDEKAANFFRKMLREEAQIRNFVDLFMKDMKGNVSSEESFKLMDSWQKFLLTTLGDLTDLTTEEVNDLTKVIRMNQVEKCSMVTQGIRKKFVDLIDDLESPLYDEYSVTLPRMNKLA